jgi:uncharacterized damage-inducible protein DinB
MCCSLQPGTGNTTARLAVSIPARRLYWLGRCNCVCLRDHSLQNDHRVAVSRADAGQANIPVEDLSRIIDNLAGSGSVRTLHPFDESWEPETLDAITILRAQLKNVHDLIEFAMNDLSFEQLHHRHDGSTISSIATIYVHVVQGEDALMNKLVREQPMLHEREGWQEQVGFGYEQYLDKIAEAVSGNSLDAFRDYAQAVYAETDAYLATLSEADLDRPVTFGPMGDFPLGIFLANFVSWHMHQHAGEICALKGCLGGQGLPF